MKPQSLQLALEASRPPAPLPGRSAGPLDELTAALEHEAAAIRELREALVQQRAAVAANDVDGVNASVDDVGRILLAVEEARRQREAMVATLTGTAGASLEGLGTLGGRPGAAPFAAARAALRRAAEETAHEATVNRAVLRRAVEAGDAFLQSLFSSATDPSPVYTPAERRDRPGTPGFILNRKA